MADLCVIRGAENLKDELARVRETLKDTDATIEKLTGRPMAFGNRPMQQQQYLPGQVRYNADDSRGRGRASSLFAMAGYSDSIGLPPAKRLSGSGTFGRLGLPVGGGPRQFPPRRGRDEEDEEDLLYKPSIQSSVIATPKDTKTRKEAIAEQQSGAGGAVGQTRNRRMFGLLVGTLAKFREDERTKEDQEVKRKAIEKKLEEKQHQEREQLLRQRQQLFLDRRRQQVKLRSLEQKIELVEMHSAWEAETLNLECFIRTNAKPHMFFLPKRHNPASRIKLEESKRILQELVADRRKQLEEEIEEIMAKGEQTKEIDHDGTEQFGSDDDMDDSMAAEPEKMIKKAGEKNAASEGEVLSDIDDDDQDHGGIEYGLSAEASNVDSVPASHAMDTSLREEINASAVSEDMPGQADSVSAVNDAEDQPVMKDVNTEETVEIEKLPEPEPDTESKSQLQDNDHQDKESRDHSDRRRRNQEEEHSKRSRKRRSRSRDADRSQRKERRRDKESGRKHRDDHEDSHGRDRHHRKHGSSRHTRDADEDGEERRHERRKNADSKHSRDGVKDNRDDKGASKKSHPNDNNAKAVGAESDE